MNETIQFIQSRKSVRQFTDEPITPEEKELILDACLQAPSGGNEEGYAIIDVTDQEVKNQLADLCDHQPFIAQAPLVLVFVNDKCRSTDLIRHYENPDYKPDVFDMGNADTFISAQNATQAAWSMGIGSCYIGDIKENFEKVQELLHLPQYVIPMTMVVFGRPTEFQWNRKKPNRFALKDMVHENYYHHKTLEETIEMYKTYAGGDEEAVKKSIHRQYTFKIQSEFRKEMIRSHKAMEEDWKK